MPKPISRRELIKRLSAFGYVGPISGKRHAHMRKGTHSVPIPNPHGGDIDWSLTKRIIEQAGISKEEWEAAK